MSDQPSESPKPVLLLISLAAVVVLGGTLALGISTELSYKPDAQHMARAPHAPAPGG